jgi:hypothetical protein
MRKLTGGRRTLPQNSILVWKPAAGVPEEKKALSENLTERPLLRNFLHPLNREEPTLVTAIRLAEDAEGVTGLGDAEGAELRLSWAGHGERLDEGIGISGISGL